MPRMAAVPTMRSIVCWVDGRTMVLSCGAAANNFAKFSELHSYIDIVYYVYVHTSAGVDGVPTYGVSIVVP